MIINTEKLIITSPYGKRIINDKEHFHKGLDFRTWDFVNNKDLDLLLPERAELLRAGIDNYGNNFSIFRPLINIDYVELKFIHTCDYVSNNYEIGEVLEEDSYLGVCIIGGNSNSLHLHFETWQKQKNGVKYPVNPVNYLIDIKRKYEYK